MREMAPVGEMIALVGEMDSTGVGKIKQEHHDMVYFCGVSAPGSERSHRPERLHRGATKNTKKKHSKQIHRTRCHLSDSHGTVCGSPFRKLVSNARLEREKDRERFRFDCYFLLFSSLIKGRRSNDNRHPQRSGEMRCRGVTLPLMRALVKLR